MIAFLTRILHRSALLQALILLIAWLAVWQLGRLVEYTEHASVWFPVAGLSFAALLVLGRRAVLPIMAGAILITIWSAEHYQLPLNAGQKIWGGFLFGVAHIAPYWLGAFMVGRLTRKAGHGAPQLIVTFLLVAGASALCATSLVIASLVVTNQMEMADFGTTFLPFWVGDMAGVIALAPLFTGVLIRLFPDPEIELTEFAREETGSLARLGNKVALNAILVASCMLLAHLTESPESSFAIFFLAVPHMWIACTESPIFNVASLAVSSFLIALLVHLLGLMDHVMVYQFAISVIAANALFGIAVPQLKANNEQLTKLLHHDSLTGAASRHYLEQRAGLEIEHSHAERTPLSLIVLDLDNFKQINDRHGHAAGDDILRRTLKAVQDVLRRNDVVARFGGDEFVVMLPDLDRPGACRVAERARAAIGRIEIGADRMACSFGVAQLSPGEDFHTLFERADMALYSAKREGGNQVSHAAD